MHDEIVVYRVMSNIPSRHDWVKVWLKREIRKGKPEIWQTSRDYQLSYKRHGEQIVADFKYRKKSVVGKWHFCAANFENWWGFGKTPEAARKELAIEMSKIFL